MAQAEPSKKAAQPPLVDNLLQYGKLGFSPELPEATRQDNQAKFHAVIESSGTLALMPALNLLVQPSRTETWLRAPLISALAVLPLRERGVQHAIEFVLSVHPSNSGYTPSTKAGRGSGISHEALNAASRLLSSPPGGMSPDEWFSGIAPQLFALLQGEGEPEMDKAAAFIIGFGILGRRQYGAPGMPGWKAFVEPMLRSIDPSLATSDTQTSTSEEEVVSVGRGKVLVSPVQIAQNLRRLHMLVTSHPHPSLTKRLLGPVLVPLWSLSSWYPSNDHIEKHYRVPARSLLKTILQLSSSTNQSSNNLSIITQNLMFRGRPAPAVPAWIYDNSTDGSIQIIQQSADKINQASPAEFDLSSIHDKTSSFSTLVGSIPDFDTEISHLFIHLCREWLKDTQGNVPGPVITRPVSTITGGQSEKSFVEAKLMQDLMTSVPEKLVSDSSQVLDLVSQILSAFKPDQIDGVDDEDMIAVALSLLNIVLTSPNALSMPDSNQTFEEIKKAVYLISKKATMDLSLTARNLLSLITFRDTLNDPNTPAPNILNDQQLEDRKNYTLALSYLTSTESPPPVRVQGLELISDLIQRQSSVLDVPSLVVLFSSLLQDGDEYIYLRVIKSFIELSNRHPKTILKELIDRYVDSNEEAELDQRLRYGEALLEVIRNIDRSFSGEIAESVGGGLLSIAGRRGFRPKHQGEQENQNILKQKRYGEAEEAWDGPPPQLDEYLPSEFAEDNEILTEITSGWESKRGSEDVRIRASALSILGSAIEANIAGLGSNLISTATDLSIHILTLEPEPAKGILRRSAILLIMCFIRALDSAREQGIKLGFGLVGKSLDDVQRVLKWVEDTDSDGLVRQHAKDVVDSLRTWQFNAFLPTQNPQTELQEIAGLAITPKGVDQSAARRPKIEEIE